MSKNAVAKQYLSKRGRSYQWVYFGTKIALDHIRKRTNAGTPQSLISHIKAISGDEENFNLKDMIVLPASYMPEVGGDLLFVLNYRGYKIDVHSYEIPRLDELIAWHAWDGWKSLIQTLHNGEWCLHISEDTNASYLSFYGKRYGNKVCPMLAFSMFDVLPIDVMEQVKKNRWRIVMENPDKALRGLVNRSTGKASLYADGMCASLLMAIPLACYSVVTGDRVKTICVDVRDLRNIYFPSTRLKVESPNFSACTTTLDLFDAMLAHGKMWSVDVENDLLYLPYLPRPPPPSRSTLTDITIDDDEGSTDVSGISTSSLLTLLPHLSEQSCRHVLMSAFPYSGKKDADMQMTELKNRMRASGSDHDSVRSGSCLRIGNKLVCMIPRPVVSV